MNRKLRHYRHIPAYSQLCLQRPTPIAMNEVSSPGTVGTQAPVKQYEVHHPGMFQTKKLEIKHNGTTILHTNKERHGLKPPRIDISSDGKTIVTSVQLEKRNRGALLLLGNPNSTDNQEWMELGCQDGHGSKHRFVFNGRPFRWTRTHNKELGARRMGGRDFKLSEEGSDQVLVVYRSNYAVMRKGHFADVDFYVDLDQDVELLALCAVLAIQENIARRQTTNILADALTLEAGTGGV